MAIKEKINARLIAFISLMGALGNVLALFSIPIPSPLPYPRIELCFSSFATLFVAVVIGPIAGAITGALGTILTTIRIGNPFIPIGHLILGYVTGRLARKFRPIIACLLGEVAESPWIWFSVIFWAHIVAKVPLSILIPIIIVINIKAFIDVFISSLIVELILRGGIESLIKRYLH